MKQILVMMAVVVLVGCGEKDLREPQAKNPQTPKATSAKLIADPIVEKAVREVLRRPTGELTKADLKKMEVLKFRNELTELPNGLEKFTQLYALVLSHNQLTSVKGLEKLTQLTYLLLKHNQLTSAKGLEKLTQLKTLDLNYNQLTSVKGLEKLTQLTELWLTGNQLTDVKGLEKLTQLTELSLQENKLTDVKDLEKLTQLKGLWLSGNQLTKAQINQLQKALPNCKIYSNPQNPVFTLDGKLIVDPIVEKAVREKLEKPEGELTEADLEKVIDLSFTQITDAGLKDVAKLQNLIGLELESKKITDAGLKEVAKLQQLTHLNLWGTQITDAGLKEVAKLQQLTHLLLNYTQITDAGLKDVAKLQRLEALSLFGTKVTEASEAELKGALPNLERLNGNPTK